MNWVQGLRTEIRDLRYQWRSIRGVKVSRIYLQSVRKLEFSETHDTRFPACLSVDPSVMDATYTPWEVYEVNLNQGTDFCQIFLPLCNMIRQMPALIL